MDSLQNFLQNLRIGGASNIPKSKLEQDLTHDSELDSPEPPQLGEPDKDINMKPAPSVPEKKPRKTIVKQTADVQDTSEFEDIQENDVAIHQPDIVPSSDAPDNANTPVPKSLESVPKSIESVPKSIESVPKPIDSEDDAIKKIWHDLNIGEDGYLTLPELEKMCNYLEMTEMDKKDIQDLFVVIDTDKDNRVSLSEFSNGLKTHSQLKRAADEMEAKHHSKKRPQNNSVKHPNSVSPAVGIQNGNVTSIFSTLDQTKQGFCNADKIVQYWRSGGILNGYDVLEYLNYKPNEMVNLIELTVRLDREMLSADLDAITLAGLISYKKELTHNRSVMEELLERILKLNKEISSVDCENSQLRNKVAELQEINIRQDEELDAVADLHRKMESELKLLRETKLIFNQTMTNNDRDELYKLKQKFEQHFEVAQNSASQKHSDSEYMDGLRNDVRTLGVKLSMSEKKVNELDKKLLLKVNEVHYLKKEIEEAKFYQKDRDHDNNQEYSKEIEKSLSIHMKRAEEFREENVKLHNKIHGLEGKIDIAINREKAYRMRIEQMEKEVEKDHILEKDVNGLRDRLNEAIRTYESKLENATHKIDELQHENKDVNACFHNLESQMVEIKDEILRKNEEIRKKTRMIDNHKNEIAHLRETLTTAEEDDRLNRVLIERLELANDRLSKSVKNAVEKMDEFSKLANDSDNRSALNENVRIRKENMLLEDEISQLNRRLTSIELSQSKNSSTEIHNLQRQNRERKERIEELEEILHKNNIDSQHDRFGSAKKIEQLQFKYEELNKKYQLQLEQVDKVDSLLRDLYDENAKLIKSMQRADIKKEENEIKIIQLEEKVLTLQNILNRAP